MNRIISTRKWIACSVLVLCIMLVATTVVSAQGTGPYHFGFKKSREGQLPSIAQEGFMSLLQKHNAIFLGDTEKKELYLTFDSGYENGYLPGILDVLKEKKVPAAFFVTGHFARGQADLLKRMANEGHVIGNHSWSHPDMTQISDTQINKELQSVAQEVANQTPQKTMRYARPPRGVFGEHMLQVCGALGYTNVFWSIAYKDWDVNQQKGWNYAYESVTRQLHPGAVILLHSISSDNAEALSKIIDEARKQGYVFMSLDQMEKKIYR